MLGFIIGTACLVGLVAVLSRGRFSRRGRCGGGEWRGEGTSGRGHRGHGRRGRRGGFGFRDGLERLFERLGTTPSQERVIADAADELRRAGREAREAFVRTRTDVAGAVRSPSFDETRVGEVFARHDEVIESLRKAAVGAVGRVHAVLEDEQRERLADLFERGLGGGFGGARRARGAE